MRAEYEEANQLMLTQIKLSPYNPEKSLYLVVDGASKIGTGFCLLQSIITILRSGDQSDIVTTPTQPQLNSKVGCDTKMTISNGLSGSVAPMGGPQRPP